MGLVLEVVLPGSKAAQGFDFRRALKRSKELLSQPGQKSQTDALDLVDSESEHLAIMAYQRTTGEPLSRMDFFSKMNDVFPEKACSLLFEWSKQRSLGCPLQYITGVQVFLDHEYEVSSAVLIPRPETELLLRAAVEVLSQETKSPSIGFEIGLGSGILSIELLSHFAELRMFASELKPGLESGLGKNAQSVALRNAERILGEGKSRLTILQAQARTEVWEPFQRLEKTQADFLITNPPYLLKMPGNLPENLNDSEVQSQVHDFEPHEALFAPGDDPSYFYQKIAESALHFIRLIRPGGSIFAEIPHERSDKIVKLFSQSEWQIEILKDLNQRDRILILKRRASRNG